MRSLHLSLAAACLIWSGCGGDGDKPRSSAATPPAASPTAGGGLVNAEAIAACAGFTAAKAADILGVGPAGVTDYSRTEGRLRMCHYRDGANRSKAVSFTLGSRESVERARASMESEREAMGGAQSAIDRVTKSPSKTPASEDVSGIGDEAFYSAMNGAIMLRVGNVLAQVTAPADMTLKRRVAEEIVKGLRR